jgi:hypothetical protein
MDGSFYLENLYETDSLRGELDSLYEYTDLNHYNKTLYRGKLNMFDSYKIHNTYEEADYYLNQILRYHMDNDINGMSLKNEIGHLCLNGPDLNWDKFPLIEKWIKTKATELFITKKMIRERILNHNTKSFDANISVSPPLLTLYKKGCRLSEHIDGKLHQDEKRYNIKWANVLLYLNKNYQADYGGMFVVDGNTSIIPTFGNILFLNFSGDSDPLHCVTEVVEDVNRFALLFNVEYIK